MRHRATVGSRSRSRMFRKPLPDSIGGRRRCACGELRGPASPPAEVYPAPWAGPGVGLLRLRMRDLALCGGAGVAE
jgi:hypothetical protein